MAKSNFSFKNFFNAGDVLAVLVIVAGSLIAIFLDDIAVKMIGISVALLGVVALFMLISGRLSDIVDANAFKKKPKGKEYELTTVQDATGKRTTVEDFDFKFGDDDLVPFSPSDNKETDSDISKSEIKDIKEQSIDNNNLVKDQNIQKNDDKSKIPYIKTEKPPIEKTLQFVDTMSSVRILGTIKRKVEDPIVTKDTSEADLTNTLSTQNIKQEAKQNIIETKEENSKLPLEQAPKQEQKNNDNSQVPTENVSADKNKFPTKYLFETDILIGDEPKLEFEYFISRILLIIKSVTDSNSVLLVLVDNKFEHFTIEAFTTDKDKNIESKRKIPVSKDIISQIIKSAKPEILSEINPAAIKDLIPYYSENVDIQSFIGIPIIWNDLVIGVMCADSTNQDCFDSATVSFMGQFSKLISGLVKSYTHKIDLLEAAKTLDVINKFQNMVLNENITKESLYNMIVDELKRMFQGYTIGIASYNYDDENWAVSIYDDGKQKILNSEIDFNSSLLGKCIVDGETIHLSGIELINIKRVLNKEAKFLSGEFVATPLRTNNGIYGAIFIESSPLEKLTDFDISILHVLSNHLAVTLERFNLINLYRSSCIVDRNTGLYNNTAFYLRLNEEIERFEESESSQLTLCFFRVDKYASLDPIKYSDRLEMAVGNALDIAKKYTKKYEIIGRIDSETFGILFINHKINDLKLIAERFRNDVANSIIEFDNTKFSVTISIGLASYHKKNGANTLVSNTIHALTKSLQFTNHVQVYN